VGFDGADAKVQRFGYLGVFHAISQQSQDLKLSVGHLSAGDNLHVHRRGEGR
jgi:hypothetical protein